MHRSDDCPSAVHSAKLRQDHGDGERTIDLVRQPWTPGEPARRPLCRDDAKTPTVNVGMICLFVDVLNKYINSMY